MTGGKERALPKAGAGLWADVDHEKRCHLTIWLALRLLPHAHCWSRFDSLHAKRRVEQGFRGLLGLPITVLEERAFKKSYDDTLDTERVTYCD